MIRSIFLGTFGLLLFALSTPAAPAPDTDEAKGSLPLPVGIADAAGKVGYVANPTDGIDAIDLATGKTLWTSKDATKPLAIAGNRLAAQAGEKDKANVLRVVVLNAENGSKLAQSDPVVFPDWVMVGLSHGRSFSSQGSVAKGELLLRWQARAWYAGGAAPPPGVQEAARKNADGVARVNLESGKVVMLDKAPETPGPKLPAGLEKAAARPYWNGTDNENRVRTVAKYAVAVDIDQAGGQAQKALLKRWDVETGKELEPVTLLEGKSLFVLWSPDDKTVLIHQALVKEALPAGDFAWWIYSTETGKQLAKIPYEQGTSTASVIGARAYYVVQVAQKAPRPGGTWDQDRLLKAVELDSGKVLWEHPIEPLRMLPPLP